MIITQRFLLIITLALLMGVNVQAGTILPNRESLNVVLGSNATTIDFQNIKLNPLNPFIDLGTNQSLSSSTLISSPQQGPGLVPNGVAFIPKTEFFAAPGSLVIGKLDWPVDQSDSIALSTSGGGGGGPPTALIIDFSVPVAVFGLDLLSPGLPFLNGINRFEVTVFGSDDASVLQTLKLDIPSASVIPMTHAFFGFSESRQIGSVKFQAQTYFGVDDVVYGSNTATTVPEPVTHTLVLIGLAALPFVRRRQAKGPERRQ